MKKLLYEYVIQELNFINMNRYWFDCYVSTDRKMTEEFLKIYRRKNPGVRYRVVRCVQ